MSDLHVLFQVDGADYVLPASDVVHMESFGGATRVPGTAPWVAGLVQIRGRVVPVVDLRARFGLPPIERGLDARVVVVQRGERLVGLLVDAAREVVPVDRDELRDPPEVLARTSHGFVRAVGPAGKRLVMSIDVDAVLGEERLHGD